MATTHVATDIGNTNHMANQNGKPTHTHIPRIYDGVNQTFNTMKIPAGGALECGICGEILQDSINPS